MSDKELIKQEIERRIAEGSSKNDISEGALALESLLDFIDSLPEEPGCEVNFTTKNEDLEEAAVSAIKKLGGMEPDDNVSYHEVKIFKAGAEWQKEKMNLILQTEYEKGLFDMQQEMMKDAVEGIIHHYADDELAAVHYNDPKGTPMSIYVSSKGLSAGDKVKIIIIKTK